MGQHASRIRDSQNANAMQKETYSQAQSTETSQSQPLKRTSYIQTSRVYKHQQEDCPSQPRWSLSLRNPPFFSILRRTVQRGQERRGLAYPTFRRTKPGQKEPGAGSRRSDRWLHAFFQEFNLVFIVDDSTSMLGDRWKEVERALAGFTPMCAAQDPEGVDVYFVNHWAEQMTGSGSESEEGYVGDEDDDEDEREEGNLGGYTNLTTASQIRVIFNALHPSGRTPFGARLSHLLLPYVRLVENMAIARADAVATGRSSDNNPVRPVRPLYIIGITDGAFTDDVEEILLQAARRLEGCRAAPRQANVQFFHVGEDEGAQRFLEALEGAVRRRRRQEGIERDVLVGDGVFSTGKRLTADGMVRGMMRAAKGRCQHLPY